MYGSNKQSSSDMVYGGNGGKGRERLGELIRDGHFGDTPSTRQIRRGIFHISFRDPFFGERILEAFF
jgi:hypothetical protein